MYIFLNKYIIVFYNKLFHIAISLNSFDFISIIGRGAFGRVWSVLSKRTLKQYALKEISKLKVIAKKNIQNILTERNILSHLHHPFFANLHYSFQDMNNLYLVLDFFQGGDLRYHLIKHKHFSETQTKFIISCILLSLEHLHSNGIVHRDIKPENILLDNNGYCFLTDFGIATRINDLSSKNASGTLGYIAPEVLYRQEQSYTIDYFALGVICYEMMNGYRPYGGKNRKEVKENVMARQVFIRKSEIPIGWSVESGDFVNKLLMRKPFKRLGINGIDEIKGHLWLKDMKWKELYLKKMRSEYIPKNGDNYDSRFCNSVEKVDMKMKEKYNSILSDKNYEMMFKEFYYFSIDDTNNNNNMNIEVVYPHKQYEDDDNNKENVPEVTYKEKPVHMKHIESERDSNVVVDMLLDKYSSPSAMLSTNMQTEALSNRIRRQQSFETFNMNYPGLMFSGNRGNRRDVLRGGLFHRGCNSNANLHYVMGKCKK